MKTALIGHTGFIGKNLDHQFDFTDQYNSKNIKEIRDKNYDLIVCSGIPASMWTANHFPDKDLENIQSLLDVLNTVKTDQFILISSTAVFKQSTKHIDEESKNFENKSEYGKHRRFAEEFISANFDNHLIVRLPALFGIELRKNFIYDLLNQEPAFMPKTRFEDVINNVSEQQQALLKKYYSFDFEKSIWSFNKEKTIKDHKRNEVLSALKKADFTALKFTHSESIFQFYDLNNLWNDICIALKNNLSVLHLSSTPIKAKKIAKKFFNIDFNNDNGSPPFNYNMKTKHARFWNKSGDYQYTKSEIISSLDRFFKDNQKD